MENSHITIFDCENESNYDHSFCPIKIENNKVIPASPMIYIDSQRNKVYSNTTHLQSMLKYIVSH